MKYLAASICLVLTSCATVPRAIIPPVSEIAKLDTAPVQAAGKATREAVRDVADAGQASREAGRKVSDATRRLSDSIIRIETLSFANDELTRSVSESLAFAKELEAEVIELNAAHAFAEGKERIALQTIDAMEGEIGHLSARVASQSAQIDHADAAQAILREQVEALAGSDAKRIIAEDKLEFWRWRFAPISIGIIVILILTVIYRPRIPFLT